MRKDTLVRWLFFVAGFAGLVPGARAQQQQSARLLEIVDKISPARHASPPKERDLSSYLLVYFKDETHSLYFATSADGYTFKDVNGGQPVLLGKDLAEQKGVRDPHIMRGPDGAFYLSMTDLHLFGQREGYRSTEWERPREQFGWGNNRALILMKSYDLLHWTHSIVRIDKLFPNLVNAGCAWAPETIFDPAQNKLMVYFTTREGNGPNFMVYSYADPAFTTLLTEPRQLFVYPKAGVNTLDGDITRIGDTYHLFYVAHDRPGNIRQATSSSLHSGYVFSPEKIDPETVGAEAPNLWKRAGTNTYVLMYDVFGAHPHNMGFSETTDFLHFKNIGRFNDPESPMKAIDFSNPKHGAVMAVTPAESARLTQYFAPYKVP